VPDRGSRATIALRAPAIRALAADGGPLQLSLFDQRDRALIARPDDPDARLVVCRNPALAEERRRERHDLLDATARKLARIQERVRRPRQPLRGAAAIGQAVGAVLGRRKGRRALRDHDHRYRSALCPRRGRNRQRGRPRRLLGAAHQRARRRPGRTRGGARLQEPGAGRARLPQLKTGDLEVRPICHGAAPRVRAHVFLRLLACHLEWHLRQALAPLLFDDRDRAAGEARRRSPVAKAEPSPAAKRKATTKRTADRLPVHAFRSLLADLAPLTRNTVRFGRVRTMPLLATPPPLQQRALSSSTSSALRSQYAPRIPRQS